jgi:flagellar hook-basal body complex protein FliE
MMTIAPIQAVGAMSDAMIAPTSQAIAPSRSSFSQMLVDGINGVSDKVASADALAKAFTLDDSIPVHQVTYALENARLSFELMLQVRGRLLEGYSQLMNMPL